MNKKNQSVRNMTQMALLVAITLVMAYTPLGYLRTPLLSVSFLTVPVAIGAILMGPAAGAALGTVFGLTSFADAFTGGGIKGILLTLNPAACFVTTVVARLLCGLLCGLVFAGLHKAFGEKKIVYLLASLSCPLFNTVFFMGFMQVFYYHTDYMQELCMSHGVTNPFALILAMIGVQGCVELVVCGTVAYAVCIPLKQYIRKK